MIGSFESIMMPIAAFQFMLFGVFLLSNNKVQAKTRLWFGLFLLCKGIIISLNILFSNQAAIEPHILAFFRSIYNPILFFYTPSLYLYIRSQTQPNQETKALDYLHFTPSIVFFGTSILITLSVSNIGYKLQGYSTWLYYAQAISYSVLSLILINSLDVHKGSSQQQHSRALLKEWLSNLMIMFLAVMMVFLANFVFFYFQIFSRETISIVTALGLLLLFVFANAVVIQILYKPQILEKLLLAVETKKHSSLPKAVNDITEQKLKNLMVDSKPYLDLEFNAKRLAALLDIHPRSLSLLLKHRLKTNFNDFTNQYRISEAKHLIERNGLDMNLSQIQYEAGFNSKSAFNDVFKKMVKMTPSEFKQAQQDRAIAR